MTCTYWLRNIWHITGLIWTYSFKTILKTMTEYNLKERMKNFLLCQKSKVVLLNTWNCKLGGIFAGWNFRWVEFSLGGIFAGWNFRWVEFSWVEFSWVEFSWVEFSWVEFSDHGATLQGFKCIYFFVRKYEPFNVFFQRRNLENISFCSINCFQTELQLAILSGPRSRVKLHFLFEQLYIWISILLWTITSTKKLGSL